MSLKADHIRRDFPVFAHHEAQGKQLVYLDSAASTPKPQQVIDALSHYYQTAHANIHRGVYDLSMKATQMHEEARSKVQHFLGAAPFRRDYLYQRDYRVYQFSSSKLGKTHPIP